jgi:hypothetical protein
MIFSCERICIPKEKVAEDGHVLPRPTKKFLATEGTKGSKSTNERDRSFVLFVFGGGVNVKQISLCGL